VGISSVPGIAGCGGAAMHFPNFVRLNFYRGAGCDLFAVLYRGDGFLQVVGLRAESKGAIA
jgi:hypothetical protein